ncbi:MAG: hypothetical protein IJ347_07595 [Faecalibacterium sp.]|nr:hypothetical protein [Faecalibacterium sp.]
MNRLHPLDAALRFARTLPAALVPPLLALLQGNPAPLTHTLRQNAALLAVLLAAAVARYAAAGWQITPEGLVVLRFGVLLPRRLVLDPARLVAATVRTTLPYRLAGAARLTLALRGVAGAPGQQIRLVVYRRHIAALLQLFAPHLGADAVPRLSLYFRAG